MTDTDENMTSPSFIPLMPTGNGVTDLEMAREQSAVADAEGIMPPEQPPMDDAAGGPQAVDHEAPVDDDRPTLSE